MEVCSPHPQRIWVGSSNNSLGYICHFEAVTTNSNPNTRRKTTPNVTCVPLPSYKNINKATAREWKFIRD